MKTIEEQIEVMQHYANGVKINSLKACLVIYKVLLNKHKNKRATIKAYKGIETKSNMWIVDKTIEIERKMK